MDRSKSKSKTKDNAKVALDLASAREITDTFFYTSGVRCIFCDENSEVIYAPKESIDVCCGCENKEICKQLHAKGISLSRRYGGSYTYDCQRNLTFSVAPVIIHGSIAGALLCGPVEMGEAEINEPSVNRIEPERMEWFARQLFADAAYISDSSHEMYIRRHANEQENKIAENVAYLKQSDASSTYPVYKETQLTKALVAGDQASAQVLLNELLGHIFLHTHNLQSIRNKIAELFLVLSRNAIHNGSDVDEVMELTNLYAEKIKRINSVDDLTIWLADSFIRYINLVYSCFDKKEFTVVRDALRYMRLHYREKIKINDVADYVGYSVPQLSRLFMKQRGQSFLKCLNEIRIEKAKEILIGQRISNAEACVQVGFSDQSYFCKVFKKYTGTTPEAFKQRSRKVSVSKESGDTAFY